MSGGGAKIKIFLFLAFAVVTIMLAANLFDLTNSGVNAIKKGNENIKCVDFKYYIKNINYENERLLFDLLSNEYDQVITKVKIESDLGVEVIKTKDINDKNLNMTGGESKYFDLNITIEKYFIIYFNECEKGFKHYV